MTVLALALPQRHPRSFLLLAALLWFGSYLSLGPFAEALVSALPVERANPEWEV